LEKADHCVNSLNWCDNTAVSELEWTPDGICGRLVRLNDGKHLADTGLATEEYEEWGLFAPDDYNML